LAEWGSWRNWLIGTSSFKLGFSNVKVGLRNFLPYDFFPHIEGYKYTTGFTGVAEEIKSTARYWTGNDKITMETEDFEILVEDTWEAVRPQYEASRLSSFDYIWKNWVKKYNMGFGFGIRNAAGRLKQMTRQQVIDHFGGKAGFRDAWEKVYRNAQSLVMPSPVFTKWESLKLKKALTRSVRTVVGSAFVHSVMTYPFNYKPNHNYKPWETPSKVGMPINGQNFDRLWRSLAGYSKVWAGDMTAFDSSQPPPLLFVAREIRKKGYSLHKDYHAICQLIDISYDMLRDQPLAFKNFGDIAVKGQGATTGHTSTTPDNTIMLIANYLFAWRAITGLRAREFFNFNTLANFGDDHVLGYDPVFGWSPEKAISCMLKIGTVMRDESPGQSWLPVPGAPLPAGVEDWRDAKFSFLSKMPLPMTDDVKSEIKAAGITVDLAFGTCHDRSRLLGKIKGEVLESKNANTKSKYEALIGYMELCAHHRDIYTELAKDSIALYNKLVFETRQSGGNAKSIRKPPSYFEVVRKWYAKGVVDPDTPTPEDDDEHKIFIYDSPDPFGLFVRWLSDFPTILSPRYRNVRWADWLQNKLVERLVWPIEYIAKANFITNDHASVRYLAARTPYAFLRSELMVPQIDSPSFQVLTSRHYLYMLYSRVVNYRRNFSPLDLLRLLDTVFINALFICTGRVTQSVVELDLHILDTLVIYLLSYVNIPFPIFALNYYVPTPSDVFAQLLTWAFSFVTPAGSIDFQSLEARLARLAVDPDASFVLDAPTGTGKSTRMVNRIQNVVNRPVVVIVPRQAVAVNVGLYMRSLYPDTGIYIGAEGHEIGENFRIVYCTVQSFFLNTRLRNNDNLFILDEAHVNEPIYNVARNWLRLGSRRRIYMTATPGDLFPGVFNLVVPAVNQFTVYDGSTKVKSLNEYLEATIAFANDRASNEKILIFVPTLKNMEKVADRVRHNVCRLSSKHKVVNPDATVYIATSVADAGLTIPDVSFVLSPNVDINVSINDVGTAINYFYLLSKLTIKQRRGRTGRTSNGAFLLYEIEDIETSELTFTTADYHVALAPAVGVASPYFPDAIKQTLDDTKRAASVYWDRPGRMPTWAGFLDQIDFITKKYGIQKTRKFFEDFFGGPNVGTATGHKVWSGPTDDEVDPITSYYRGESTVLTAELPKTHALYEPEDAYLSDDPSIPDDSDLDDEFDEPAWTPPKQVVPQVTRPQPTGRLDRSTWRKHDVSGKGLLCGVHSVIGVIYTVRGVRRSPEFIQTQLREFMDPEVMTAHLTHDFEYNAQFATDRMYQYTCLQDLLLKKYFIKCLFRCDGVDFFGTRPPVGDERESQPLEGHQSIIWLDYAHYNYLGVPYSDVPVNDEGRIDFSPLTGELLPEFSIPVPPKESNYLRSKGLIK